MCYFLKKVLSGIGTVVLVILLVIVAIISISLIMTSDDKGGPNILGYHPMVVLSDSMEDTIMTNDLILVKKVDTATLQKGDIISFCGSVDGQEAVLTHRIHRVYQENGKTYYETIGDNNNGTIDQTEGMYNRQDPVTPENVIGKYTGFRVGNYKDMILYCLVIPIAIIFIWQLVHVIVLIVKMNGEKQLEKVQAEKDKVIEEYLRAQQAAQTASEQSNDEAPAEQADADNTDTTAE